MSAPAILCRALVLIEALAGHVVDGMRLSALAELVQQPAYATLRDLQALAALGYAERIPGREDSWRLTSRICRVAHAHREEMTRQRLRIDQIDHNYTRTPN